MEIDFDMDPRAIPEVLAEDRALHSPRVFDETTRQTVLEASAGASMRALPLFVDRREHQSLAPSVRAAQVSEWLKTPDARWWREERQKLWSVDGAE
jgi:hypothetical protein